MIYSLALVALAGLGTASPLGADSPGTQAGDAAFNPGLVVAATSPSLTGPPVTATAQTTVYNPSTAAAIASSAATAVASAKAASMPAGPSRRGFCFWGFCFGTPTSSSNNQGQYGWPAPTSTSPTKVAVVTTTSAAPVITTPASITLPPSTCTPISWTNTNAFTTATGCAAPFEVGTYCGFINPEDPCAPQPSGDGPQVQPDTVAAFEAYPAFHQDALGAVAPSGYASTFKDLNASVNANTYLGLHTLQSYDVAQCASFCDSTNLCTGINIYIERDPSINPDQCSCTNPSSITNYKCTLWGSGVDQAAATNFGQSRDGFQVVIAGSNGYEKTNNTTPTTPSGWTKPQNCGGNIHSHPSTCLGQKFFPGPYDVNVCAAYAAAQNAKNSKSLGLASFASWFGYSPLKCNFFNAFMVKENGIPQGTYCNLFTQQYAPSGATYQPGNSGGINWGVESSWSFCSS
ncbi:uncharacterized protein LY79DRAFT_526277 [Colletotrichum navitas]|uniref:Uncharacterized protein n=1 Tax=Colletotrichum navitas TaxID=681940 RepID=A0AAD8V0E7_9PEZI|nr:uncharacterized protein LY79DRAFT_526277 [Colletotrichum navitas]KAK1573194.1 hypothetical protein LY79DRAFT_526277 [Colletotrichum navitas]